ncbi:MAG: alanine--tRNA ligase, partial [Patescibacteria group bacterium]|nr:alanine--tRNA ligase [Patescibacteria group bacterium]
FEKRGHTVIPSAPLVPENDPTVLFITAGMHPLVPYLLGQPHPSGKRLTNFQKCLRTDDIDEVGDATHNTFFEMLGNWSLGDYWKKEALSWSWEFLTSKDYLNIDSEKIYVTVFAGDQDAPKDVESIEIWQSLGVPKERIFEYGKKENWWGPAGETGPCGPSTEMFIDSGKEHDPKFGEKCHLHCNCLRYVEVWNDVLMQYNKRSDGTFEPLKQRNVDTGMGLERMTMILEGKSSIYETELFNSIMETIRTLSSPDRYDDKSARIIADHIRAVVFLIVDGITPSNKERGYILRRLLRRAAVKMFRMSSRSTLRNLETIGLEVLAIYNGLYNIDSENSNQVDLVGRVINEEVSRFSDTLDRGLKEFQKTVEPLVQQKKEKNLPFFPVPGIFAFHLYDTYGFPPELTDEMAKEAGLSGVNWEEYRREFEKHQALSRAGAEAKFKGGLADQSEQTSRLHTATHLLQAALRQVLGPYVYQKGSNITAERLRFDFSSPEKVTEEQLKRVEELVNQKIKEDLPVKREEMGTEEAKRLGSLGLFTEKYGERVSVYTIDRSGEIFSKEICGGPHASQTGSLGRFKIIKEEAVSAGVRRIKAVLED